MNCADALIPEDTVMNPPPPSGKTIGLAILSWKSPITVKASIDTYIARDFFSLFDDVVLCFQEIDDTDRALADACGLRCVGNAVNTGIQGGFRLASDSLGTDYVIVLENDLPLIASRDEAARLLDDCLELFERGLIDMARLRSRFNPGQPIRAASVYSQFYPVRRQDPRWAGSELIDRAPACIKLLRRLLHPMKAHKWSGRAVYIEESPEEFFPETIRREGDFFIVDSSVMPWTNQPTLLSGQLLAELLDFADAHPSARTVNGFQDFEKPLNCRYWKHRHFQIAVTPGIFTHQRLDR